MIHQKKLMDETRIFYKSGKRPTSNAERPTPNFPHILN
jgi:hypothetical protein